MPRRRSPALTDGELRVMRVLWDRSRATVSEVAEAMAQQGQTLAYNTVLTMLRILERKGYVTHEKAGRAFAYRPVIDRRQARHRALSHLLNRFFDDSPELLVLNLLEHDEIDAVELGRIRTLVSDGGVGLVTKGGRSR